MVSFISIFQGIRFRLIVIVILTTSAFLFQNNFLTSVENTVDEFESKGLEYQINDISILRDLEDLKTIVDELENDHVFTFLNQLLFTDTFDEDDRVSDISEYETIVADLSNLLEERQESGYFIQTSSTDPITSSISDISEVTIGSNDGITGSPIIDVEGTGVNSIFNNILNSFTFVNDTSISVGELGVYVKESNTLRVSHVNSLTNFATGDVDIIGVLPRIQLNIYDLIEQIQNSGSVNASDLIDLVLQEFELITNVIIGLSTFEVRILQNATIGETNRFNEVAKFLEFTQQTKSQVTTLSNEIGQTILLAGLGNDLRDIDGATKNLFNSLVNTIDSSLELIGVKFPGAINKIRGELIFVELKLDAEVGSFNAKFEASITQLRGQANDLVSQVSLIIIVVLVFIIGLTTLQLIRYFTRVEKNYKLITAGDLTIPPKSRYSDNELGNMDKGFDDMLFEIKRILSTLQRSSERMAGISEELAAGAEEASASVQEVSNTVREFSAGASEQTLMLTRIDEKLNVHLVDIQEAVRRINETSTFVLRVAKRTNILGLNASIEAAKAGRFGLGFNVVAEEVRNLSDDTKNSALEIAELIESIEYRIQQTVREMLQEVGITKDVAENTAAGSEEASASTSEQVVMLSEISQTSNELSQLANELQELLSRFVLEK